MKVLKINRAKWRTGIDSRHQTGEGETMLLNDEGYMCCLGFLSNQVGIPKKKLIGIGEPVDLEPVCKKKLVNVGLIDEDERNSKFCNRAMTLNDSDTTTSPTREKRLKALFQKNKIKVIFTGKYLIPYPIRRHWG